MKTGVQDLVLTMSGALGYALPLLFFRAFLPVACEQVEKLFTTQMRIGCNTPDRVGRRTSVNKDQ